MIDDQGWLDWAIRTPGPADKVYSAPNACQGYIPHSMVGYLGGWYSRLFSTERDAAGRYTDYAAASVHCSILLDGTVVQHYPFTASCWGSGSRYANTMFIAVENEGGYDPVDEPLREPQIVSSLRIVRDLSAWKGWSPRRPTGPDDLTATLYEHRECVRFGSPSTACPSNRMDGLWKRMLEEESMDNETFARMLKENWAAFNELSEGFIQNAFGDLRKRITTLESAVGAEQRQQIRDALVALARSLEAK